MDPSPIRILKLLDEAYHNDAKPVVPDHIYDCLWEKVKEKYGNHPYFLSFGATPSTDKVELPVPMPGLSKFSPAEAFKWIKSLGSREVIVTPKLDGISLLLEYDNGKLVAAYTRGDSVEGKNVFHHAYRVNGVRLMITPTKQNAKIIRGKFYVRGEVIMHKSIFQSLGYKSTPRNLVAGLFNRKNVDDSITVLRQCTFVGYSVQKPGIAINKFVQFQLLAQQKIPHVTNPGRLMPLFPGTNRKELVNKFEPVSNFFYRADEVSSPDLLMDLFRRWRNDIDIDQDGVVIETADSREAYKVKPDVQNQIAVKATIQRVALSITARQIYKPVAYFTEPLNFNGVKVSKATLNNIDNVIKNGYGPGAVVSVIRSGDVIPRIIKAIRPARYTPPRSCRYCNSALKVGVDLQCSNAKCCGHHLEKMVHFFSTMKVGGVSRGILQRLIEGGADTPQKILALTNDGMRKIDGFAGKLGTNVVSAIKAAVKSANLPRLMHASGYFSSPTFGIGEERLKAIVNAVGEKGVMQTPDQLKNRIIGIPGIGPAVQDQFLASLPEFQNFYRTLKNINLATTNRGGKLAGNVFVFTMFRDPDLEKYIESNGGEIGQSVTARTTVLFSAGSSTKTTRAQEKGIVVVDKTNAWKYVRGITQ